MSASSTTPTQSSSAKKIKICRKHTEQQIRNLARRNGFYALFSDNKKTAIMFAIYNGKYHTEYALDVNYSLDVANYYRFVVKSNNYMQFYYNSLDGEFKSYTHYYLATHFLDIFDLSNALVHLKKSIDYDCNHMAHETLAYIYNNVIMYYPDTKITWATSQEIAEALYKCDLLTQYTDETLLETEVFDKLYSNIIAAAKKNSGNIHKLIDNILHVTNIKISNTSDIHNKVNILQTVFDAILLCLSGCCFEHFYDSFLETKIIPFINIHKNLIASDENLIRHLGKPTEYREIFYKILNINIMMFNKSLIDFDIVLIIAILCTEPDDYNERRLDPISNNKSHIIIDYIKQIEEQLTNKLLEDIRIHSAHNSHSPYSIDVINMIKNYSPFMRIIYHIITLSNYLITNSNNIL